MLRLLNKPNDYPPYSASTALYAAEPATYIHTHQPFPVLDLCITVLEPLCHIIVTEIRFANKSRQM